MHIYFPAQLVS